MKKLLLGLLLLSSMAFVETDLLGDCLHWQQECDMWHGCCGTLTCGVLAFGGQCACPDGQHHTSGDNCEND